MSFQFKMLRGLDGMCVCLCVCVDLSTIRNLTLDSPAPLKYSAFRKYGLVPNC